MPDWREEIRKRLDGLKLAPVREAEIVEELAQHLEDCYRELVSGGATEDDARRTALEELSDKDLLAGGLRGVEHEAPQEATVSGGGGSHDLLAAAWQDVRYGLRQLRRNPGFTIVAVLTLALGIGANTAMFSVIYGVLLRPLPYPQPQRIVRLTWPGSGTDLTAKQFTFYRKHSTVFESTGGFSGISTAKLQRGNSVQWIKTLAVTQGFFPTLGINPVLGRNFGGEEELPGGPEAMIVTHSLWKAAFNADPDIVGRPVTLADKRFTIIGVLPAGFQFVDPAEAFIPLRFTGGAADLGSNTSAIARLRPGVTLSMAQAEMGVVFKGFARVNGSHHGEIGIALIPYQEFLAGSYRPSLLILFGAVGFLLLIACANVASLLIARSASRQKEISLRLALGASRVRLFSQFFTESVLLAIGGGAAGLTAAFWMLHVLVAAIPWDLPATDRIALDLPVLLFTLLIAFASSIAFGLASFLQTSEAKVTSALKEGWSRAGASHSRLRKGIVTAELAISLMMLVGAGLLVESLHNLYQQPTGFDSRGLYAVSMPFEKSRASSVANVWNFDQAVMRCLRAIPGVKSAAVVNELPLASQFNVPVQREGHPDQSIGAMQFRTSSPDLFATMGVPVLRGRPFTDADTTGSQPVILVSESLARRWWGNQNPIGDRIIVGMYHGQGFADLTEPARTIVGVVGDVRVMGLDVPMRPTVYIPVTQAPQNLQAQWMRSATFLVRASGAGNLQASLRRAVAGVDPTQRVTIVEPMTKVISGTVSRPRFRSLLLGLFACLALILTAVGLYGVISYSVARRTHEIGIRMAMGAEKSDVLKMVVGQGLRLALVGVGIGTVGALVLTKFLSSLLFGVKPTDPLTFVAVSLILVAVALAACYIPARRAARVDPMVALRYE
jgi:putative ABC transport system permease protein